MTTRHLLAAIVIACFIVLFAREHVVHAATMRSCATVTVRTNNITFTDGNGVKVKVHYRDLGYIQYSRPVPAYVNNLVTKGKGTKVRKGCGSLAGKYVSIDPANEPDGGGAPFNNLKPGCAVINFSPDYSTGWVAYRTGHTITLDSFTSTPENGAEYRFTVVPTYVWNATQDLVGLQVGDFNTCASDNDLPRNG
jgi:hypothetical protein